MQAPRACDWEAAETRALAAGKAADRPRHGSGPNGQGHGPLRLGDVQRLRLGRVPRDPSLHRLCDGLHGWRHHTVKVPESSPKSLPKRIST